MIDTFDPDEYDPQVHASQETFLEGYDDFLTMPDCTDLPEGVIADVRRAQVAFHVAAIFLERANDGICEFIDDVCAAADVEKTEEGYPLVEDPEHFDPVEDCLTKTANAIILELLIATENDPDPRNIIRSVGLDQNAVDVLTSELYRRIKS